MFYNLYRRLKHVIIHKSIFFILSIRNGIIVQGILHDLDKLSWQSLIAYSKWDMGLINKYVKRHRERNRHHPQHWHTRGLSIPHNHLVAMATDFHAVSHTKPGGLKPVAYVRKNLHSTYKHLISTEDLLRLVVVFEKLKYFK